MLIATSHNCARDTTYEEIEVLAQPMPTFEADITQGCPGLQVQFKNTTQDTNITGFIWDFGDGTPTFTGVEPPVHTYTGDQEYYTVTLTASNALGCSNTEVKVQYIHIMPPPLALFDVDPSVQISIPNYTFKFIDQSQNNPDQWIWDFGDGSGSSEKVPVTYLCRYRNI
ncbi:PKD domain-containing protein [Pedobacter steynii]